MQNLSCRGGGYDDGESNLWLRGGTDYGTYSDLPSPPRSMYFRGFGSPKWPSQSMCPALDRACVATQDEEEDLVRFISIIISNRSFTLKTSDGQIGRLRRLKMESRAHSWLRHYLTSTSAISLLPRHPSTHMQMTLHSCTRTETGRRLRTHLTTDMDALAKNLRTWRLNLSTAKKHRNTFYSDHKGGLSTACSQAGWLNTAVQLYPDFP